MPELLDASLENDLSQLETGTPPSVARVAQAPAPVRAITLELPAQPGTGAGLAGGRLAPAFAHEQLLIYHDDLLRRARALTRDASRAQDLVQDTLERAIRHMDRLPADSTLRSWLYVIMSNRFLDLARAESKRRPAPLDQEPAVVEDDPPPWWASITTAQLKKALEGLRPEIRATFELREFRRLSYAEVASTLKIPVATVGTRLGRARIQLREILSVAFDSKVNQ
jgi:RNA polymerase sigma-70 factor (ECF subfamily)